MIADVLDGRVWVASRLGLAIRVEGGVPHRGAGRENLSGLHNCNAELERATSLRS